MVYFFLFCLFLLVMNHLNTPVLKCTIQFNNNIPIFQIWFFVPINQRRFISPELKLKWKFQSHFARSPSVIYVICKLVHFLLSAYFNRTWHKSFLGYGLSSLFEWKTRHLPIGLQRVWSRDQPNVYLRELFNLFIS